MRPLALLLLAACSKSTESFPTPPDPGGKGPIDDAPWFDADHVLTVEVELDPDDLSAIRDQTRDFFDTLGGDCTSEPFETPFTWFEADVVVDGDRLERVGIRKKGFLGSLSWEKPSFKISTDEWVPDQLLPNGTERLTLNNNVQDPAVIRQCLGLGVFAAAGVPAPRCNFATVTVNGEAFGLYTHIEDVRKDFLRRHFADEDGDLYEGTLSDFASGWTGTFDPKTADTDPNAVIVAAITQALDAPDDQVVDALGEVVDLPAFYRFWAVETLLAHWDGYASNQNNFFIYRDPDTDLVSFVPWGVDQVFVEPGAPNVFLTGRMTQRLWSVRAGRDGYVDAMEEILATAWDEDALHAEIDRMAALVGPYGDPADLEIQLGPTREFVNGRRAVIEAELDELRSWQTEFVERDPFCVTDLGPFQGTFDTVYTTLEEDPFLHAATLTGDTVPSPLYSGAIAGPGEYGEYVVAMLGVTYDWATLYQAVLILPPGTTAGTWPVGFEFATAYLVRVDLTNPYDEGDVVGIIVGEVRLDQSSEVYGEPVVGEVNGIVVGGLW